MFKAIDQIQEFTVPKTKIDSLQEYLLGLKCHKIN